MSASDEPYRAFHAAADEHEKALAVYWQVKTRQAYDATVKAFDDMSRELKAALAKAQKSTTVD